MATLATDTFTRTVAASSWGNADTGGAWTLFADSGSSWSVNGTQGVVSFGTAGRGAYNRLGSVSDTSTEVYGELTVPALPVGGSVFSHISPRSISEAANGTTTAYKITSSITTAGAVNLGISVNGASVANAGTILTAVAGDVLAYRTQAFGTSPTTIRGRVWKKGATEPTTWQVNTTDSTANLQVAGAISLGHTVSSALTNLPYVLRWDNVSAQNVVSSPPTANAGADLTVNAGAVTINDASATDPDGYIATYGWSFVNTPPGVAAPTITNGTTATPSFTLPQSGRYELQMTATDNSGLSDTDNKIVFWPGTNIYVTGVDTNPGWSLAGGTDIVSNLNDTNDGTGVDAPGSATTESDLVLVLAPLISNAATFSMTVRELLTAAATGVTYVIKLVDQGVTRKTWTKTADLSTSATDSTCTLTTAEIATITNWNDLRVVIGWQTS
jgi:hypothetical protein